MVFNAANFNCFHFVLPGNPAQKRPKPLPERGADQRSALFGAEHAMVIGAHVGHACYSAVPSGLAQFKSISPALKRRAILRMSLRDKPMAEPLVAGPTFISFTLPDIRSPGLIWAPSQTFSPSLHRRSAGRGVPKGGNRIALQWLTRGTPHNVFSFPLGVRISNASLNAVARVTPCAP